MFQDEMLGKLLIKTFLRDCSEDDHKLLMKRETYLRFLFYQDSQDSEPYLYGYLRKISDCSFESHKKILLNIDKNYLPFEITFATYAQFLLVCLKEWESKDINENNIIMLD